MNYFKTITLLPVLVFILIACNSTAAAHNAPAAQIATAAHDGASFSDIQNKDWLLTELRAVPEINFNRDMLAQAGFGESFTIHFGEDRVSGVGAPNRYTAPYTQADGQGLTIMPAAQTMMAAIFEPEGLKEHDFFSYLFNFFLRF